MKLVILKSLTTVKGECGLIPKAKISEEYAELLAYPVNLQGELYYIFSLAMLKLLKERCEELGLNDIVMRINVLTRDPISKGTCICDNSTTITFKGARLHEEIPLTDSEVFFYGPDIAREKKKEEVLTSIRNLKKMLRLDDWEHIVVVGNDLSLIDCDNPEFPPLTFFQTFVKDDYQLKDPQYKVVTILQPT
ncbi:hypothetical protein [Stygiolobus caldivivus]|uniref:Uncharacterized protein n=1 Tax=Stygiolobus caldivivus TaxID=2824673 RepID=A0A8D5ZGQ1_9CREN|nr:hypothetical protein [Stygiolobus caldivivus]BCU69029.1 hypothetical protein KN1_03260 [Stygiolobus caldivivus]